jgi:hypothetical protein
LLVRHIWQSVDRMQMNVRRKKSSHSCISGSLRVVEARLPLC